MVRGYGSQRSSTRGETAIRRTQNAAVSLSPRNACLVSPAGGSTYEWADLPQQSGEPATTPWALFLADRSQRFRLIGIDLDDHDGTSGADVATDLTLLRTVLDRLALPYLICASGGGQGRHVWLHCEPTSPTVVDRIRFSLKLLCSTVDQAPLANPKSGALRAPGSPHRNGGRSIPLAHGDYPTGLAALTDLVAYPCSAGEISALADELTAMAQPLRDAQTARTSSAPQHRPEPTPAPHFSAPIHATAADRELAPFVTELLNSPPPSDTSRTAFSIARGFVIAGRSSHDFVRAALTDRAPGLEHIRTERIRTHSAARAARRDPESFAHAQYEKAQASVPLRQLPSAGRSSHSTNARREVEEIALTSVAIADRARMWTGPTGSVFHRALAGLAAVTIARGRRTVSLSARVWAATTGLTAPQISLAARALESAGWIEEVHSAAGPLATQWRICDKRGPGGWVTQFLNTGGTQGAGGNKGSSLETARRLVEHVTRSGRRDAWSLPGTGTTGHAIWLSLTVHGPQSVAGLSARLGMDRRTICKTLRVLATFDLARSCGGDMARALPVDRSDSHCRLLGLDGVQERRWARYVEESTLWAVRCAERVWRTSHRTDRVPDEVMRLRRHVCVDRVNFRSESSFPRAIGVPLEQLQQIAQAWRRRLVDSEDLTDAELAVIGRAAASDPPADPPDAATSLSVGAAA